MKTILISGGAGYLGTHLTKHLLKRNKVIIYDKFYFPWLIKNKKKINYGNRLSFIKKDIKEVVVEDFRDVDVVCDLNGIPNDPASEINPNLTWKINYSGRLNFAKIAKKAGVKRYIFNSTCSVYGFNKNKVDENSKTNPISTYAKANLKAERAVYKLKDKFFLVNILRNSTLFGFSNVLRLDLVINIFVYNLIYKKKIIIDGDGKQYRPFISLNDICKVYDLIIRSSEKNSFICNLVSFNSTIRDIALSICKILKKKYSNITFKEKSADLRNYYVLSKNFKSIFKSKFRFSKFSAEILFLKKEIIKNKIKLNKSTIRMKFYKSLF